MPQAPPSPDLPERWLWMLASYDEKSSVGWFGAIHAAIARLLRRSIDLGLDRWIMPGSQLGDLIFSTRDEIGLEEGIHPRITIGIDFDGRTFAVLSDHSPGFFYIARMSVQGRIEIGLYPPDHVSEHLLREILGAPSDSTDVPQCHGGTRRLPAGSDVGGFRWKPRVELLDENDPDRETQVLVGLFADLWRIGRPGTPLPPMLQNV